MATWPQTPTWNPTSTINEGKQFLPADGVTVSDMNRIIENMIYLKKYGGKVNVLSVDAQVVGTTLKLTSEDA